MRLRLLALLCVLALLLGGCGYWIVEAAPEQVGSSLLVPSPSLSPE